MNMSMTDYLIARNQMLLKGDIDEMMAFMRKFAPHVALDRITAEVALHKARTTALGLPDDVRAKSRDWLMERGYAPMG